MDKNINQLIFQHVWAIRPEKLAAIMELAAIRASGKELTNAEIQARIGEGPSSQSPRIIGSVGVLPIYGTIAPKMDLMTEMSGGSSIEGMQQTFRAMMADDKVESILLDIDSPGGVTDMVPEFAKEIREARGTKPITAIANTQAASAALWLGSQADQLFITPSGGVGSIGCFAGHEDISAQQEKDGIKTTLVKAGKFKAEFNPYEPLSDSARAEMQRKVDISHQQFVEDVAAGREVDPWTVLTSYGEGRMLDASEALAVGMVDGIETFDDVVARLHTKVVPSNDVPAKEDRTMDELLTKFADKLGITIEDGDDEAAVLAKADSLNAVIEPLRKAKDSAEKVKSFAAEFPQEYEEMKSLRAARVENEAHKFAENYERLHVKKDDGTAEPSPTKGFSAIVLAAVEDTHKKLAYGDLEVNDLKNLMDIVADEKNAIVEYAESGSSRTKESIGKGSEGGNARSTFAELVNEIMVQDSLEYGAAVSAAAKKNPDLFDEYQNAPVA